MSDPVTNVEIEDVLSSIRRLVSDGDKARTRDPAPEEEAEHEAVEAPENGESQHSSAPQERLVLTPAFLVVDSDQPEKADDAAESEAEDAAEVQAPDDDHAPDEETDQPQAEVSAFEDHDKPYELTDLVEAEADSHAEPEAEQPQETPTTDRSELVATIAELEAAISSDDEEYELDGSEPMAETIAWPGTVARPFDKIEDAQPSEGEPEADTSDAPDNVAEFHRSHEPVEGSDVDEAETASVQDENADDYGDDDLDGLLEAGGVSLDEDALRSLVAEVVREELMGPLGERITRNVRKLVRREIYRVLSSQEFD